MISNAMNQCATAVDHSRLAMCALMDIWCISSDDHQVVGMHNSKSSFELITHRHWRLLGLRGKLFPSAMFIDMTSRGDVRSYQGCVAIYYGDDSSWCMFAPMLCRFRGGLLVCSKAYSHQDCVNWYLYTVYCMYELICLCLFDSAIIIAFKITSSGSMIVCTQKSLCLLKIKMNADDGSSFFKKLYL